MPRWFVSDIYPIGWNQSTPSRTPTTTLFPISNPAKGAQHHHRRFHVKSCWTIYMNYSVTLLWPVPTNFLSEALEHDSGTWHVIFPSSEPWGKNTNMAQYEVAVNQQKQRLIGTLPIEIVSILCIGGPDRVVWCDCGEGLICSSGWARLKEVRWWLLWGWWGEWKEFRRLRRNGRCGRSLVPVDQTSDYARAGIRKTLRVRQLYSP